MIDGQQQRRALTAAEQAIRALAAGSHDKAAAAAGRAEELDQVGAYEGFQRAITGAAAGESWESILDIVGPGPLAALVAELRTDESASPP